MGPTELIIALPFLLFLIVIGLAIIASGQVFLAIRETALNTRKEESEKSSQYGVLLTVAKLNNVIGWLIIIFGILAGLIYFGGSSQYFF